MIVQRHICTEYENEISASSLEMKKVVSKSTMDLFVWCTKWRRELSDPLIKETLKFRFVEDENGNVLEASFDTVIQDSITPNKSKLSAMDDKIFSTYLELRKVGFKRPSVIVSESFWRNIINDDTMMEKEKESWPAFNLMNCRLQDNSRIAVQLSLGGEFLKRTYQTENGVVIDLGKEKLIEIMKKRKLVR